MTTWERLEWDSEFFGIPIGRVEPAGATDDDLERAEADARAAGIACLYATLDPADVAATVRVQEHGYRFVDAAVVSDKPTSDPPLARPEGVSFRQGGPDDLDAITELTTMLADWSRFAVDPRFGWEAGRRVQAAGVARAAADTSGGRSLHIAEDETGPIAFITRFSDPEPGIDAIGTSIRGAGSPHYLVQQTREWAGAMGARRMLGGPIPARNVAGLRFVQGMGFRVVQVRYHYHRWLDR